MPEPSAGSRKPKVCSVTEFAVLVIEVQREAVFGGDGLVDHHLKVVVVGRRGVDQFIVIAKARAGREGNEVQESAAARIDAARRDDVAWKRRTCRRIDDAAGDGGEIAGTHRRGGNRRDAVNAVAGALAGVIEEPERFSRS